MGYFTEPRSDRDQQLAGLDLAALHAEVAEQAEDESKGRKAKK